MENPIEERNRAETRQTVEMITESRKRKRINTANKNKTNYARMLVNFRTNRMKRTVRVNMIAGKVGKKKEQEAPVNTHKKSFTTSLHNILDADLLGELTIEDSQLSQHILAKDREGFSRLGSYMANFWDDASVINDCMIIDKRVAIPTCLRKAVMARLHRTHPGQEAMVDAAQYLWWPKMHKEIIDLCQSCRSCSAYDQQRLESSLLKPEEMRESADSRTRMKVVKKGMASRDVSPKLKRNEEEPKSIRALENLAKAASDWKLHRRHLSHKEGSEALRKLTERNPLLAASLRSDLNQGTLRFGVEQEVPEQRTKTSLGKKTPTASTPRKPLHQCSSSRPNRPIHILPRPDVSPVSTSTENSDTENMTLDRPLEKLDRLQAKTMKLYSTLTKKESANSSFQICSIAKRT